jgi:hypothetical protein
MMGALIVLSLLAVPIEAPAAPRYTIEACDVKLTEAGRGARFRTSFIYRLSTDAAGHRAALTPVKVDRGASLVDLGSLESCIGRWRLDADHAYFVVLTAGTTGDMYPNWELRIHDADNDALPLLTILLPRHSCPSEDS